MKYVATIFAVILSSSFIFADDLDVKLEKVLYPSVRVTNGQGGGSGTVIYSEDREKSGSFQTYVLTNHHVIENLLRVEKVWDNLTQSYKYTENNELASVELFSYDNGGKTVTVNKVKGEVIAYKKDEDMAVLRLIHPFQFAHVTQLLPKDKHLRLFQDIYAVGSPLLVDPIFTKGEVTGLAVIIDKKPYTGGSAQIIWGNSGGSVMTFVDSQWYLCGIPSRGAMAGNGQMVTHLAYYITPERIAEFFRSQKLDFLLDSSVTPTKSFEERAKLQKSTSEGPDLKEQYDRQQHDNHKVETVQKSF